MRYLSDLVSDGVESHPLPTLPDGFVPDSYGVYAADPADGTDRWVADFADAFRAEQYARLFNRPTLEPASRNSYRCRACGYAWSAVGSGPDVDDCPVCEERDMEPERTETVF